MRKLTKHVLTGVVALGLLAPIVTQAISNNPQTTVNAKRHHHSAWHYGIPSAVRGHYTSYSYIHGHIRHGERTHINLNRASASIGPKGAPDPFGLKHVRTKKIGYHKYMISGKIESVGSQGHASLIVTKYGHRAYIRCTNNKLGTKRNVNGRYYTNRYTHIFRVLNSEV